MDESGMRGGALVFHADLVCFLKVLIEDDIAVVSHRVQTCFLAEKDKGREDRQEARGEAHRRTAERGRISCTVRCDVM